jgi:hypothetical protein
MTSHADGGAPRAVPAFDPVERAENHSAPSAAAGSMCLVTPTYWRDLELCELLCESIDRYVTSFEKHFLIVAGVRHG